jgi:hypothetical protein
MLKSLFRNIQKRKLEKKLNYSIILSKHWFLLIIKYVTYTKQVMKFFVHTIMTFVMA